MRLLSLRRKREERLERCQEAVFFLQGGQAIVGFEAIADDDGSRISQGFVPAEQAEGDRVVAARELI
jgi:hypothetical protein